MKDSAEIDPTVDPLYVASALIFSSLLGKGGSLISLLYISMISLSSTMGPGLKINKASVGSDGHQYEVEAVKPLTVLLVAIPVYSTVVQSARRLDLYCILYPDI